MVCVCIFLMTGAPEGSIESGSEKNCGFPWVVTSTGPGGFMIFMCIF